MDGQARLAPVTVSHAARAIPFKGVLGYEGAEEYQGGTV